MIANFKNGIVSAKGNAVKAFSDLTQSLWKKITTTNWLSAGGNIVSKIASGISMFVSKAALNAQILARVIMQNITKINWLSVGKNVVSKIVSGLLSLVGKMASTAKSLAMRAVTAFKRN